MSKKNDAYQDATASAAGIRVGLQLWLFFLISFVFLQYSVPISILLGAIGGLAGGAVVTWWYSKDIPPEPSSEETAENSPDPTTDNRSGRRRRDSKEQRNSPPFIGRLLGEKRTLSSQPRRR